MTGGFTHEPKTSDSFHPMIHSALNDTPHVVYDKKQRVIGVKRESFDLKRIPKVKDHKIPFLLPSITDF